MSDEKKRLRETTQYSLEKVVEEALRTQKYLLEVQGPDNFSQRIILADQEITIGRGEDCDLTLADPNVSRKHARIFRQAEEYCVEDLKSTNGTYLNNVQMVKSILRPHDQVRIGNFFINFTFNEGDASGSS